jgi:rubrerythrin
MSLEEAFAFAFKEELRFGELYKKLYHIADDEDAKELFRELSDMEVGHVERLKQLYSTTFQGKTPVLEAVATPGNMIGGKKLTVRSGLEFAVVREEYAADHYFMMADMALTDEVKSLLTALAEEEEKHAVLLEHKLDNLEL